MRVVSTAGHVDHGKSALVEALTGTHPDRLKEEREREMTIDLGYAYLTLPNGEEVGIVDVPGHRDFIENMLAGVGGIDAVLFVVAADEGVMPQTREHLAILDLLQVPTGVVALTKCDLAPDPQWLNLVEEDVRALLRGTVLAEAPIVRVSARTKMGLAALLQALQEVLAHHPPRRDLGRPRLPIDRAFTLPGFGTVVTGTLLDGSLHVGDVLEVLPQGIAGRVRGLQVHRRPVEVARPGSRTAVNLAGVSVEQVRRGDVLVYPGTYRPTQRLDVHFRLLPDAVAPLRHNAEVKLFLLAAEVMARVRLLGRESLAPGEEAFLQLELRQPIVAVRGDRFILRRPSPGATLGGGQVLDPHPPGRHKRFAPQVLRRLEALARGTAEDVVWEALRSQGVVARAQWQGLGLDLETIDRALHALQAQGEVLNPDGTGQWWLAREVAERLQTRTLEALRAYHQRYPMRPGMPREELRQRVGVPAAAWEAWLAWLQARGLVAYRADLVWAAEHRITFPPEVAQRVEALLAQFAANPRTPPTVKVCRETVGEEAFRALLALGRLVQVSEEVVFRPEDLEALTQQVVAYLQQHGAATVAELRTALETTRRYALALLEYLDAQGITVREGDVRRLRGMV